MFSVYVMTTIVVISLFDALIKGKIMTRFAWADIPNFWKNNNKYPVVFFSASFVIVVLVGLSSFSGINSIYFILWVLLGCASGVESLFYWWWLRPLCIKQAAHWLPGRPIVGWFQYPKEAPWLNPLLIPLYLSKPSVVTTRRGVYKSFLLFIITLALFDIIFR